MTVVIMRAQVQHMKQCKGLLDYTTCKQEDCHHMIQMYIYRMQETSDMYWAPGMELPYAPQSHVHHSDSPGDQSVVATLQFFQDSMEKQFSSIIDKLDVMGGRMTALETRQKVLEDEVRSSTASSTSVSPSVSDSAKKRKRVTPAALQVSFLYIYFVYMLITVADCYFRVKFVHYITLLMNKEGLKRVNRK